MEVLSFESFLSFQPAQATHLYAESAKMLAGTWLTHIENFEFGIV